MEVNDLLDEIDRRLFDLQTFLASSEGLGNNVFDQIVLTDPSGTPSYVIDHVASPPTGLVITPGVFYNDVYADVSWTAPADGAAIAYDVEWAKRNGSAGAYTYELINASRVHGNSFRIPALEAGTWYGARVSGVNRAGFISSTLPAAGFQDFQTPVDASVPVAPTGVVVFAGLKSLVVRWDDNTEPDVAKGSGTYLVQVATDNVFAAIVKQEFVSGTVATFVDLASNTTYYVRVYAIDQTGNQSPASATASGTTGQAVSQDLIDGAVTATKMQAGSANLLMDSSFEGTNLARYWTIGAGWIRQVGAAGHGTAYASCATTRTTAGWDALQQSILVTPGSSLTVTFVYGLSSNMVGSHFKLDYYDAANNFLSSWQPLVGTSGPVAAWTRVTGTNTVPANAVKAIVSVMSGWSSNGASASTTVDAIYICTLGALPTGVTWAPASNEILPAMVFGDMIVANAIQVWNMAANSVNASAIIANSINSNHIAVVGLDAGVIKFGSMSGTLITANTANIAILVSSSLTTQTITLAGGTLQAGNPPTTGLLINSQGLRLYAGSVQTLTLDAATGSATFGGTVSSSATISGSTITGATITTGNYTLTPSQFAIVAATTYSDTRAIRWTGSGGFTQARMWTYDAGNLGKTYNGNFHIEANELDLAGDIYRLANAAQTYTYITIFPNNASATGNVILGSGGAGSQVSVSAGTPLMVGSTGAAVYPGLEVRGYTGIFDNGQDIGEVFGGIATVRTVNSANTAYREHQASIHSDMGSDPEIKNIQGAVGNREMMTIVKGMGRPYRFKYKKGWHDNGKKTFIGLSAPDFPVEAQSFGSLKVDEKSDDVRTAVGLNPQAQIAILWGAVQELIEEIESLKAAA